MDQGEFLRVLKQGRGRAMPMLREHGAGACREGLLHACLHDLCADLDLLDFRAKREDYLFELVQATGELHVYRDAVVRAIDHGAVVAPDDVGQLMGLSRRFAQFGDSGARRALYIRFHTRADDGEFHHATELVCLDGLDGFLVAAERLEGADWEEGYGWRFWMWVQELTDQLAADEAWQALDHAASEHAWLTPMLASERERRGARSKPNPRWQISTYEELGQRIASGGRAASTQVMRWGQHASREDLARAADSALAAGSAREMALWLGAFQERRFPGDPGRLLPLGTHPDGNVRGAALRALGNIRDGRVRELALETAWDPEWIAGAVTLFRANLQPGDEVFIEDQLRHSADSAAFHAAGHRLFAVVDAHPEAALDGALLTLIEEGYCTMCRQSAAEPLQKRGSLPAWFLEEAPFDANPDIREMVAGRPDA